jgi:multicomponent Na+:H+ antiporter subunit D
MSMLYWLVIVPIFIAVFLYTFPFKKAGKLIAISAQAAMTGYAFYIFLLSRSEDVVTNIGGFEGVLGITLRADTISAVFLMLSSVIFMIVAIYNFNENMNSLFWMLKFVWQGLLAGIFLSQDLFNIFVLVEVSTVAVAVLIMFNRDKRSMRDGLIYFMISIIAAQFYLFGVGYIYKLTGTLDISLAAEALVANDSGSLILPYAFIITFICLKCAMVPLFAWLPKAHATPGAPSSVSALLSGLYVKITVFLFIRIEPIFQVIDLSIFFLIIGILTGVVGFVYALAQTDIKLILAYHTISQVGIIIAGLSLEGEYSFMGGLYHAINHALFKSALFLSAGAIISAYGNRDIGDIRGVFKRYPLLGIATVMAIFGITGTPLFNGSISKYFIMSGTGFIVTAAFVLINLGTIISFMKYSAILFGSQSVKIEKIKIGLSKQIVVLAMGTLCLIGGIFGEQTIYLMFGVDLSVNAIGYLEKVFLFFLSVVLGFIIYMFFVRKSLLLKRLRAVEMGFRGICVSMGVFFAAILLVSGFVLR